METLSLRCPPRPFVYAHPRPRVFASLRLCVSTPPRLRVPASLHRYGLRTAAADPLGHSIGVLRHVERVSLTVHRKNGPTLPPGEAGGQNVNLKVNRCNFQGA
jgi:hypothetical protein